MGIKWGHEYKAINAVPGWGQLSTAVNHSLRWAQTTNFGNYRTEERKGKTGSKGKQSRLVFPAQPGLSLSCLRTRSGWGGGVGGRVLRADPSERVITSDLLLSPMTFFQVWASDVCRQILEHSEVGMRPCQKAAVLPCWCPCPSPHPAPPMAVSPV